MAVKLFRAVWFLSLLVATAVLLYQYASLPESVVVLEDGAHSFSIGRDGFFYTIVGLLGFTNVLVFLVSKVKGNDPSFRSWFYGLIITINFFFVIAVSFIALFNGGEHYDFQRLNPVIYFSVGLFIVWAIAWPFYLLFKRISAKP